MKKRRWGSSVSPADRVRGALMRKAEGKELPIVEELRPEEIKDLLKELEEEHGGEEAFRREARDIALQRLEEAYAAEAQDEFETALAKCDLAIQLNPGLAEAHNLRGIVLEELRREQEAVAAYREATRLDPGSAEARENLQELEAELKKDRDWLPRYEREAVTASRKAVRNPQLKEAAESAQQQRSWLAPTELILLHGGEFATTSSATVKLGGWVGLNVEEMMLAAAFLAVEQAGDVHLEVCRQQALFGLIRSDKLYILLREHTTSWPEYSCESWLQPLAQRLQSRGCNHVSEIIWNWMEQDHSSPWTQVRNFVYAGLATRGLLETQRKAGIRGFLLGESYVLPEETAAMATQQSLEPVRELLETCRHTRPEVWRLLIKGINQGIRRRKEWDYD